MTIEEFRRLKKNDRLIYEGKVLDVANNGKLMDGISWIKVEHNKKEFKVSEETFCFICDDKHMTFQRKIITELRKI